MGDLFKLRGPMVVVVWTRKVAVAPAVISSLMYFEGVTDGSETNFRFG